MDIYTLKSRAYAHEEVDKYGQHIRRIALNKLSRDTITLEQKERAIVELKRQKEIFVAGIKPGQLVFVGMGMENNTDIGNHRIRTRIDRGNGRRFFVEIDINHSQYSNNWEMCVDCIVDTNQQEEYQGKCEKLLRYGRDNWTSSMKLDWEKYNKQPYYGYMIDEARAFLKDREPTKQNVIAFINFIFDVEFTSMFVDNHYTRTEDFICISL